VLNGIKETERKEIERGMRAWNNGSGTCKKASQPGTEAVITQRRRGGGQGDPALGSKAGLHRGKEGPFLTSVAAGRRAGVGEEMVDAAKRKAAALVWEAERRRG
jgi:hypothetical protein